MLRIYGAYGIHVHLFYLSIGYLCITPDITLGCFVKMAYVHKEVTLSSSPRLAQNYNRNLHCHIFYSPLVPLYCCTVRTLCVYWFMCIYLYVCVMKI